MTSNKSEGTLLPFIDVLFCTLLVLVAIISLLQVTKKTTDDVIEKNAIYQVILTWEGESKNDVDLWVKDSKNRTVGFNRREGGAGSLHSLAHDDLGAINDVKEGEVIQENREVVNIRGCTAGEWVVNAHLYAKRDEKVPCRVTAKLIKVKPFKEIISIEKALIGYGDEVTFFRFTFDDTENVIDTNDLPARIAKADQ